MKQNLAILLLSVYLLTATQLRELLKFPLLVEHFMEHKHQNNKLSLLNFLAMHYAHGDVKDADYDKDMKLPFKSYTDCSTTFVFVSIPTTVFSFYAKKALFFEVKPSIYYKEQHLIDAYLSSIWQPPKAC